MSEPLGDIGPEITARPATKQPGGFSDPPVPRAAGVIAGCIIVTIAAVFIVGFLLLQVDEPPPPGAAPTTWIHP